MKKLILLLFIPLFFTCSDDEGNICIYEPTLSTEAVTDITETSATLNGVISIVSENCDVPNNAEQGFVYSTEIQPTIDDIQVNVNGTSISTTLDGLEANTTYYVRSFLTNALGEFYGNEVEFTTTEPQLTYIPYDFWESKLIDFGLDDVMDNYVLTENISNIEEFYFTVTTAQDINTIDFTGIEDFTSLKRAHISYSFCADNDAVNCSIVTVDNVYIENFNISTLIDLEFIGFGVNAINTHFQNLDLSNNINLKDLLVYGNTQQVILDSTLDISNNINLESLMGTFYTNQNFGVNEIDVSNNVNLKGYTVGCGTMTDINLNNNVLLEALWMTCVEGLDELDLTNNVNLKSLYLQSQIGSNIDLTNNSLLESLTIMPLGISNPGEGFLTEINLTNQPNLSYLALENNKLTELDISNCNQESILVYASGNNLTCVEASQSQINNGTFFIGIDENGDEVEVLTDCN